MRINVASNEYLAEKFLKEIASATSRKELDVIDRSMDKNVALGTLTWGTWNTVHVVWSQRYFSL
jgi:hypothetical protein